jgi:hypothetical protein
VDEQIRQNVHKSYAGIMTDSHRKWIAMAAGVVALLAVGSQFLAGQALAPSPLVVIPVLPVSPVLGATSVQPKITWSTTSINVILSPGESTSSNLTFTSSLPLQNAVIEAVPGLAGFLNIQPNTMPSLSAGQQQAVHIAISIPPSTPFGTYDGTIHVRVGTTTFPQTMKITVNVWNSFTRATYSIKFPPNWNFYAVNDTITGFFPTGKQADPSSEYIGDIVVESFQNAPGFDLTSFYRTLAQVDLFTNCETSTSLTVSGFSAAKFVGVFGMIPSSTISVNKGATVVEFSDVGQLHQNDGILDLIASTIR